MSNVNSILDGAVLEKVSDGANYLNIVLYTNIMFTPNVVFITLCCSPVVIALSDS